ncbi:hypothetical protein TNCV_4120351 [Trichonephila clavipes]|nr:hypothetical protein TNCV_4120351 [Trichonephila clavipes]
MMALGSESLNFQPAICGLTEWSGSRNSASHYLIRVLVSSPDVTEDQECRMADSWFNGPYGRQGCVLAWTVESNQGGRFDGNESVADSFRSGALKRTLKRTYTPFLGAFFPLSSARKTSRLESELAARGHPCVHSFPLR